MSRILPRPALWLEQAEPWPDAELLAACERVFSVLRGEVGPLIAPADFAVRQIAPLRRLLETYNVPFVPYLAFASREPGEASQTWPDLRQIANSLQPHGTDVSLALIDTTLMGQAGRELVSRVRAALDAGRHRPLVGWVRWLGADAFYPDGADFVLDWLPRGVRPLAAGPEPSANVDPVLPVVEAGRYFPMALPAAGSFLWSAPPPPAARGTARGHRIRKAALLLSRDALERHAHNHGSAAAPFSVLRVALDREQPAEKTEEDLLELRLCLQRPYAASASTPAASDPIQPAKGGARVAVILHLFFTDLWEEFLRVLERLPFAFDLYVSVPYRARSALAQRVQSRFPDAIVFGVRNLGRDISPFLRVLSAVGADRYEYFLKLHGKKSLHLENTRVAALGNGAEWRTSAASSLTGGGNGAQALLDWLDRHPDVGLVAPDGMLFDAEAWSAGTRDVLAQLGTRLGVDLIPRGTFPAGTMFWARAEALQPLFRLPPEALEFEREAGQTDATLHHAYERAFALIARQGGYRVVDTTEAGT